MNAGEALRFTAIAVRLLDRPTFDDDAELGADVLRAVAHREANAGLVAVIPAAAAGYVLRVLCGERPRYGIANPMTWMRPWRADA